MPKFWAFLRYLLDPLLLPPFPYSSLSLRQGSLQSRGLAFDVAGLGPLLPPPPLRFFNRKVPHRSEGFGAFTALNLKSGLLWIQTAAPYLDRLAPRLLWSRPLGGEGDGADSAALAPCFARLGLRAGF